MSKYCVLIILPVLIFDTKLYNTHLISVLKKMNPLVDNLAS